MKSFFVVVPSGFWGSLEDIKEVIPLRDPFYTVSQEKLGTLCKTMSVPR